MDYCKEHFQLLTLLLTYCTGFGATVMHAVLEEKGETVVGVVLNVISAARADATVISLNYLYYYYY